MLSCDRYAKYEAMLYPIDSVAQERPDSAMRLLEALEHRIEDAPERVKAYYGLMKTKYMLKSGARFTSDSAIRAVAGYYDRHGDDNHRMLSKLLLGCVNRSMGDNTEAMLNLEAAAASADTTACTRCSDRCTPTFRRYISTNICRATSSAPRSFATATPCGRAIRSRR